jgi:hypothetical protein
MDPKLLEGLAAIGLFALPGLALTELVPALRRRPLPRRAAYGYLLGVATVAGALYFLSHAFGVPLRPPAVWATVAAPVAAGLIFGLARRRGGRSAGRQVRSPEHRGSWRPAAWLADLGGPLPLACALVAALVCCGMLAEAVSNPIRDWDGRMSWDTQARYVRAAGTVDARVLRDARWYVTNPQYPLLLPVAQVAVLEAFGADPDTHQVRAIYAAFLPVLLLLVYDGARRVAGRSAAALVVLAAATVPFFTFGEGGAFSTYSDLPLACFYGAGLVLLLGPRPRIGDGLAAGLLLGAAALTKKEGLLLGVLALALGWRGARARTVHPAPAVAPAAAPPSRQSRHSSWSETSQPPAVQRRTGPPPAATVQRLVVAAVPLLLATALLLSWRSAIPTRPEQDYPDLLSTGRLWPGIFTNLALSAPLLVKQAFRVHHWAGFWWMVPAVLIAGRHALRHPLDRRLLIAAAGPPAIGWAAYAIDWNPVLTASVSWERFLLQASVPLLIALAHACAEIDRHFRQRRKARQTPAANQPQRPSQRVQP